MKIKLAIALFIFSVFSLQGMDVADTQKIDGANAQKLYELYLTAQSSIKKLMQKVGSKKSGFRVPIEHQQAFSDFYYFIKNPDYQLSTDSIRILKSCNLLDQQNQVPEQLREAVKTHDEEYKKEYPGNDGSDKVNAQDPYELLYKGAKEILNTLSQNYAYSAMVKDFYLSINDPSYELTPPSIQALKLFKLTNEHGKIEVNLRQAFLKYDRVYEKDEALHIQAVPTTIGVVEIQDECEKLYKTTLGILIKLTQNNTDRENGWAVKDYYFGIKYPAHKLTPIARSIFEPLKLLDACGKVPEAIREAFNKYHTPDKQSDTEHTQSKEKTDEKKTPWKCASKPDEKTAQWKSATATGFDFK